MALGIGSDDVYMGQPSGYKESKTINVGSGAIGTGMGILGAGASAIMARQNAKDQDRRQITQQRELNKLNTQQAMDLTDYNYQKQLQMWKDTNYSAQMNEMEKAGLNAGLMYGMGGGGGTTVGSGSGASAGSSQASNSAQTEASGTQATQGMALLLGQMKLMDAQTKKTEAETEKIKGVDTENVTANTELTNARVKLETIAGNIAKTTEKDAIQNIVWGAKRMEYDAGITGNELSISDKTLIEKQEIIRQSAVGAMIENQAKRVGVKLDEAKINQISQEILQKWELVKQGQQAVDTNKFANEIKANYPSIWNVGGKAVNDFIDGLNHLIGEKDYKKHSVENNK